MATRRDDPAPNPIRSPKVLIVEGEDERRFFTPLLEHLGIGDVDVRPIGGKDQICRNLRLLALPSPGFAGVHALGVVRDADSSPEGAFTSVCDALRNAGLPAPRACLEPCGEELRVAVMVLPSADAPGTLEDLCLRSVEDDPAMPCVEKYFDCLRQCRSDPQLDVSRKRANVFIASRPSTAELPGQAAQAGLWPWHSDAFNGVRQFLKSLFAEPKR
ncbi:MAG: DUF3226 domain-containing protein [Planctomycetota bacterium]